MAIITKSQLLEDALQRSKPYGLRGVVNEERLFSRISSTTSVFLSHSHQNKNEIKNAKAILETHGVNVYVDWMDKTMPEATNEDTALQIKNKIAINEKFIFLGTNEAVASKWCNWEIGIGDIKKLSSDQMAIFGLADNKGDWKGNEYLSIYPTIEKLENSTNNHGKRIPNGYYVMYPSKTSSRVYKPLKEWLNKK